MKSMKVLIAVAVCYLVGFGSIALINAGSSTVTPGSSMQSNPNPGVAGDDWTSPWVGSIYTEAGDVWVHGHGSLSNPTQGTPTQKINDHA